MQSWSVDWMSGCVNGTVGEMTSFLNIWSPQGVFVDVLCIVVSRLPPAVLIRRVAVDATFVRIVAVLVQGVVILSAWNVVI